MRSSVRWTVEKWENASETPLAVGAVLFLIAYAWPILDTRLSHEWHETCRWVNVVTWIAFAVDYVVRVALAGDRGRYVVRHLPDLAVVALPVLRPLRLLRLVMLLRVLNRQATESLRGRVAVYVGGSASILIFCAALAVLNSERGQRGANIVTFGDALWWAVTTVSTVGYGDRYPTTTEGRWVAVGLMIGGVALIGVVTASFASWLIDRVRESDEAVRAATRRDVRELTAEVAALRAAVEAAVSSTDRHP